MKTYYTWTLLSILIASVTFTATGQTLVSVSHNDTRPSVTGNLIQNGSFEAFTYLSGAAAAANERHYFMPAPYAYSNSYGLDNWVVTGGGFNSYAHFYADGVCHQSVLTTSANAQPSCPNNFNGNVCLYFGNSTAHKFIYQGTGAVPRLNLAGNGVFTLPPGIKTASSHDVSNVGIDPITITQNVSGLTPSTCYQLSFWVSSESKLGHSAPGMFFVKIGNIDTVWLAMPGWASDNFDPIDMGTSAYYHVQFIPSGGSVNISIGQRGHIDKNATYSMGTPPSGYQYPVNNAVMPLLGLDNASSDYFTWRSTELSSANELQPPPNHPTPCPSGPPFSNNCGTRTTSQTAELVLDDIILIPSSCVVLPIQMGHLSGSMQDGKVLLKWNTHSEVPNSFFEILRSTDGIRFEKVAHKAAKGLSEGYNYAFTDKGTDTKTFYRIKFKDSKGAFKYSNTVVLSVKSSGSDLAVSPNHFTNFITVKVNTSLAQKAFIVVRDLSGRAVLNKWVTLEKGANSIHVSDNLGRLAKGWYFVEAGLKEGILRKEILKQ